MIHRTAGAALRALLFATIVALPALALPGLRSDVTQMVAILALAGGVLTFVEYMSTFPSVTEFRASPPYNRLRFLALTGIVVCLTLIVRNVAYPSPSGDMVFSAGSTFGRVLDFPFSPLRLMVMNMPDDARPETLAVGRACAALAFVISAIMAAIFASTVRIMKWPTRRQAFNVWKNLPRFDPTAGGDVLMRLRRDAHLNFLLGVLLPFLIPAAMEVSAVFGAAIPLAGPLTLIWVMTAWAFLPASLMMRGVALMRIAGLIEEERRRAYARSEDFQPV